MLKIPCDYESLLRDRVLIITGVGRSGTTILGKVLGSMHQAYYLFEPAIMKYWFNPEMQQSAAMLQAILFEDYLLPSIQTRHCNYNPDDWSWVGNYSDLGDVRWRKKNLGRRAEAIEFVKDKGFYIIKTNEFQPYLEQAKATLPGMRVIHIIRNGNAVINSSVSRGWYTDDYMNSTIIDWVEETPDGNVPHCIDDESKALFSKWTPVTRAACMWRTLVQEGMRFTADNLDICYQMKYETFVQNIGIYMEILPTKYDLKITKITEKHIESIRKFQLEPIISMVEQIEDPERGKFVELMDKLGYSI